MKKVTKKTKKKTAKRTAKKTARKTSTRKTKEVKRLEAEVKSLKLALRKATKAPRIVRMMSIMRKKLSIVTSNAVDEVRHRIKGAILHTITALVIVRGNVRKRLTAIMSELNSERHREARMALVAAILGK